MFTQTDSPYREAKAPGTLRLDSSIEDYVDALLERIPETWWAAPRGQIVVEAKRRATATPKSASVEDYLTGILRESIVRYCDNERFGGGHCYEYYAQLRDDEIWSQLQHPMLSDDDRDGICSELQVAPDEMADRYVGICQECGREIDPRELAQSLATCARELCGGCYAKSAM